MELAMFIQIKQRFQKLDGIKTLQKTKRIQY